MANRGDVRRKRLSAGRSFEPSRRIWTPKHGGKPMVVMSVVAPALSKTRARRKNLRTFLAVVVAGVSGFLPLSPAAAQPAFTAVIDDSPLEIKLLPGEVVTDAVKEFYATGENPYKGNPTALDDGKKIYLEWCQACHMPDGSGRIGPSFIGETHHYPRFATDKGMFEIIYGGATGAMQPFGNRLTQDQILHVMAYVRSLKK
jgi:cytochrome c-L